MNARPWTDYVVRFMVSDSTHAYPIIGPTAPHVSHKTAILEAEIERRLADAVPTIPGCALTDVDWTGDAGGVDWGWERGSVDWGQDNG